MRKLSEWQKFERTGRIADYLAYACDRSMEDPESDPARAGMGTERSAAFSSDGVSVKAGEDTAGSEGKDRSFVYAGYHHGDGNGSESRTDRRI
ncbi:MAG: hypothetical protein LUE16_07420 [Lachnospiraceae bacterium]|nr:hypothetical protein [Lachnospiraceae bacterium]